MAPLEHLEELSLNGDKTTAADSYVSSAGLRSLPVLKRLKTLHLRRDSQGPPHPKYAPFRLDDGDELPVPEDDLASFRLAVAALRKAKPGILIDGDTYAIRSRGETNYGPSFSDDMFHYGKATWLPESGVGWMTPSQRAEFEAKGGWARFDGAGWKTSPFDP